MSSITNGAGLMGKLLLASVFIAACTIVTRLISSLKLSAALKKYPMVNEKWDAEAKKAFTLDANSILQKGVEMVGFPNPLVDTF
jgi:hypothetical protein